MSGEIAMPGLDAEPKPSRRLWMFAAVGAIALHLGGAALAVAHLRSGDIADTDTLGAQAIEVGIQMTSPEPDDDADLPLGPGTEASAASQEMAEQKAEVKEAELPKEIPTKTEDADRAVTPSDEKKPEEDNPQAATAAAAQSAAVEATAKQTIEDAAPTADVARAPNIGLGKDAEKLKAKWGAKISGYVQSHMRYPKVRKNKTANVIVNLVLNREGHLLSVAVSQSSGDAIFDEAALSTIRRSDPLPRPPVALTDEQFSFDLPMRFKDVN